MYPAQFDYHSAGSVEETLSLMDEHADEDAELLAGGHSLLPTMKSGLAEPDVVIDIGDIPGLDGVTVGEATTTIGALTNYATLVDDDEAREAIPVVAEATAEIGDIQVRNAGTVGGNLAHADPASDLPAAMLVADATVHAEGPDGERTIPIDDFFLATYATALDERELLTRVEVPTVGPHDTGAYVKKASPSSGYAMVGVAARLETDGEEIENARVAANGALDHAARLEPVEDALEGVAVDDADAAGEAAAHATEDVEEWQLMDDLQASGEFRAQLLEVYAERAIQQALDRVD
jgi:carbon-monoxide dehydrogenase medium subunit